jgi:hypothetical protein
MGFLKSHLMKLSAQSASSDSSHIWLVQHPPPSTAGVSLNCFHPTWTTWWCMLRDHIFMNQRTVLAFVYGGKIFCYCLHNVICVFTAELCALYQVILYIWRQPRQHDLLCIVSISRVLMANHVTIPSLMRFWFKCLTFRSQSSLLACPATRPLMLQLKQLVCTEPSLLIELSAVMFASSSIMLFYCNGKTNGLTLRVTNCAWRSHPFRHDIPLSVPFWRRNEDHRNDVRRNKDKSQYALYKFWNDQEYDPVDEMMNILKLTCKGKCLDILKGFHTYKAAKYKLFWMNSTLLSLMYCSI